MQIRIRAILTLATVVCGLHGAPVRATSAPRALAVSGELFNSAGAPITQTSVNFKLLVYDAADQCVIYSEEHLAEDLSQTIGRFSLYLGGGSSIVNNVSTLHGLDEKVFVNAGSTVVANCSSSPIVMNGGDERHIRILYDLGAGYVTMTPAVPVVSSAYALVAETLAGLKPTDLLQVNASGSSALTQVNTEYAFSGVNWPRLKALLDGTSGQYLGTTPTTPVDIHGQKIVNVADPVAAQDVATKHYADGNVGGSPLDLTAVGPMVGDGSTLKWDATANKWVAGILSTVPTGTAGGDLAGTYPNPTLRNEAVTADKVSMSGGGINRLLITDATTGATIGFGTCALNQVYAWTATGFACTSVAALAPVTSVAGKTGAVVLNAADIAGLGTAAVHDVGTAANQIPLLGTGGKLPAVDGSDLLNVNATKLQSRTVASVQPTAGQVLGWNQSASQWEPVAGAVPNAVNIATANGILGGPITTTGTLSVDAGTTASKIVQLNASAQLPAVDGSLLTQVNAVKLQTRTVAATLPTGGQVLGWNTSLSQWEPIFAAQGSVVNIGSGTGLLGGPISQSGTLSVDVGTAASKILQLNASAQIPAVDGSLLTQVNAVKLQARTVAATVPAAGQVLGWNIGLSQWEPVSGTAGAVTNVATANGLLGGPITSTGTISIDTGTTASKILQLNASAQVPAVDGSLLTQINATKLQARTVAATPPTAGQVLGWNTSLSQWEPLNASTGTVTNVASGVGILGGPITANGTLNVDVGTTASKILQLNAGAQIPAVDGSLLTQVNAVRLQTRAVSASAPTAGQVLGWNTSLSQWEPASASAGTVTNVATANGILGGPITSTGTISIDTGTTASKILQLNALAQIPPVDGSLIFSVNAVRLQTRTVAATAPTTGQVLGWNTSLSQWEPVGTSTGTVMAVASGVGLTGGPITSNGTLNVDVGTAASKILQLNASAQIPAVDGSLLTQVNAVRLQSRTVAATAPAAGQVLGWNTSLSQWEPVSGTAGAVTNVATANGILGGPITSTGTISIDTGTTASKILQLNASAQIPAVDGSLLTGVNAVKLQARVVAATAPSAGQVLGWNVGLSQWEPVATSSGSVTSVASGVGLLGGPITANGTLNVDVGTTASKILQLNAGAQIPAVDGSLLTQVNAVRLQTRTIAATAPVSGQVLGWNSGLAQWEPVSGTAGAVTNIATANGILGGPITSTGTISIDTGSTASKIVQLNAFAQLPAVDGSLLTQVNAVKLQARPVAATAPTSGQVLGWNTSLSQWEPLTTSTGTVTNVASGTGLLGGPVTANGTLAVDVGTSASKILQLNASAQVPAVDGSLLSQINAVKLQTRTVAATQPTSGQVLGWNTSLSQWEPTSGTAGAVTNVATANGILGGPITSTGTISIDTGTAASKILQLNASAQIPGVDGSLLTQVNAVKLQARTVAATQPNAGQVLGWNTSLSQWEPTSAAAGSVTSVATSTGLLGGPITSNGTIGVDVGSSANKIVQENVNGQIAQLLGTAALPSYTFAGNPSTGVYSPGANQLSISTNGTAALNVVASGNVGIGTASPSANLHIYSTTAQDALVVRANNAGLFRIDQYGQINTNTVSYFNALVAVYGPQTISGTLGVGTTAPQAALDVATTGTNSAIIVPRDTTTNRPSTGVNGMIRYNTTLNAVEGFVNGAWSTFASGSSAGTVTNVASGTGLLGGPITTNGTLSVDVGTTASKIVQLNGAAQIAIGAGSFGSPAYSFAGDTDTGMMATAANEMSFITGGNSNFTLFADRSAAFSSNVSLYQHANADLALTVTNPVANKGASVNVGAQSLFANTNYYATSGGTTTSWQTGMGGSTNFGIVNANGSPFSIESTAPHGQLWLAGSGYVGIGTVGPRAALDVFATGTNSAMLVPRDTTANRPSGVNGMLRYNTSLSAMEGFINGSWSTLSSGATAGTVTSVAGGAGILGGPITTNGTLSVDVGTSAAKIVQLNANAQVAPSFGTAALPSYSFAGNPAAGMYSPATNKVSLVTNGTAAVTIGTDGKVGIGTDTATERLSIESPQDTYLAMSEAGTNYVKIGRADSGGGTVTLSGPLGQVVSLDARTSYPSYVANGGNFGINTKFPQAGLDVATTGTGSSAIIVPRDTTANRPTGVNGMLRYNNTLNVMEGFINGVWSTLSSGSSAGTVMNVATSTGLLGGPITTNGTLSVDVGSAANKIVQENVNAQIAQMLGTVALPSYSFVGNAATGMYSPAANQLALATNGTAALNVIENGNVGIGTTNPTMNLSLGGSGANRTIGMEPAASGSGFGLTLKAGGAASGATNGNGGALTLSAGDTTGYGGSQINFNTTSSSQPGGTAAHSATTRMVLDSGGRLGINETFPTFMLEVSGGGPSVARFKNNSLPAAGNEGGISFGNQNSAYSTSSFGEIRGGTTTATAGSEDGYLKFLNVRAGTMAEAMRITSAGNVGIGTGAPQALLDLNGVGSSSALLVPRDTTANRPAGVNGMLRYNTTSAKFEAYENGAWANLIGTGGSLTFPILAPNGSNSAPVYSFSASSTTGVYSPNPNQLGLSANGVLGILVDDSGNIGIGTNAATATVDINKQTLQVRGNASSAGELRLQPGPNIGTNYVGFQGPVTNPSTSVLWRLPAADGTAGQVLTTNGTAALSWTTPPTGGGSTINCGDYSSNQARLMSSPSNYWAPFCLIGQSTSFQNTNWIGRTATNYGAAVLSCANDGADLCSAADVKKAYGANTSALGGVQMWTSTMGYVSQTQNPITCSSGNCQPQEWQPYVFNNGSLSNGHTDLGQQQYQFFCCRH